MRPFDVVLFALVATTCAGCEAALPGGDLGAGAAASDAGPPLPTASGCLPFQSLPGIDAVTGAVRSIAQGDGGILFVVDDAIAGDADIPSLAVTAPVTATLSDCLGAAGVAGGAPMSALDPPSLSPMSGVVAGDTALLYYGDGYGNVGVATQDPVDGRFRPGAVLLWTSDRPAYGSAAVASNGSAFAIGCQAARFLDADCFVASTPFGSTDDESAYSYYVGGGRWSPRVDDAWPMTTGASSLDIAWLASSNRWLMVYVTPLGNTLTVRSGLTPEGPWSAPIPVATCDLADSDMFCSGIHAHPLLDAGSGAVVVSYAPASLSSDASARRAAQPAKWAPRIVSLPLPVLP